MQFCATDRLTGCSNFLDKVPESLITPVIARESTFTYILVWICLGEGSLLKRQTCECVALGHHCEWLHFFLCLFVLPNETRRALIKLYAGLLRLQTITALDMPIKRDKKTLVKCIFCQKQCCLFAPKRFLARTCIV